MIAYCWGTGELVFGWHLPSRALPIARLPKGVDENEWQRTIQGFCRRGYESGLFLIPGIPEAENQLKAVDALHDFCMFLEPVLKKLQKG